MYLQGQREDSVPFTCLQGVLECRCSSCRVTGYVLGLLGELFCGEACVSLAVGFLTTSLPLSLSSLIAHSCPCCAQQALCTCKIRCIGSGQLLLLEGGSLQEWHGKDHLWAMITRVLQVHFFFTPNSFPYCFLQRSDLNFALNRELAISLYYHTMVLF